MDELRLNPRDADATAILGSAPSRIEADARFVLEPPQLPSDKSVSLGASSRVTDDVSSIHSSVSQASGSSSASQASGSSSASRSSLSPSGVSRSSVGPSASVVTTEQGMQLFAARRAWTFAVALSALCAGAVLIVALLGGDPIGQKIHIAGIGATGLMGAAYALRYRNPARFNPKILLVLIYTSMIANATGYFYWGVFSAYFGVVSVTAYAFASGAAQRHVIQATIVATILHLGIGGSLVAGWLVPHGLVTASKDFSQVAQVVVLLLLQMILYGATWGGLDAQRKMRAVLDEHDVALRELSQREAQLAEAHEAVRDARRIDEGRYSGETLGRFRLGAIIGRGAMGEVYAAQAEGITCAVKVLANHLLSDDAALKRFHREARIIAALDAPNLIHMIEVSPPGSTVPFIAMERLAGQDLGSLLKGKPVLPQAEVVEVIRAVATGLHVAHAAGVIHRDLKPANLFAATTAEGTIWKVLDFGVAKAGGSDATMTVGQVVGTPGYMAPEQARGESLDARADVYSLAVIAYRMLTGRPVVVPGDLPAMIHEVVYRMPPAPSRLAEVSAQVEAVLIIGLAKSRSQRFVGVVAFADALEAAATNQLSRDLLARAAAIRARTPWDQWVRKQL